MKTVDFILGLDIGTSCAKVVLQAPYMLDGKAWGVHFGSMGHKTNPYLLPARIYISKRGVTSLTPSPDASLFPAAKELLLRSERTAVSPMSGAHPPVEDKMLTTMFTALVIKSAMTWFYRELASKFSDSAFRWHANMGLPSKGYDDGEIRRTFNQVLRCACLLSQCGEITLDSAAKALAEQDHRRMPVLANFDAGDVNVIPEVIAEFNGYARSGQRRDGVHVMVDVGATTLDVCAFNVYKKDGEDHYPFITAIVTEFGAVKLHQYRLGVLRSLFPKQVDEMDVLADPVAPLPEDVESYLRNPLLVMQESDKVDRPFLLEARLSFTQTIDALVCLCPHSAEWRSTGIPMFFCGGGSLMPFYHQKLLKEANTFLSRSYAQRKPFVRREIPRPRALEVNGLRRDDYHRLAVAYGLSFPARDIGKVLSAPKIVRHKKDRRFDVAHFVHGGIPKEYC